MGRRRKDETSYEVDIGELFGVKGIKLKMNSTKEEELFQLVKYYKSIILQQAEKIKKQSEGIKLLKERIKQLEGDKNATKERPETGERHEDERNDSESSDE